MNEEKLRLTKQAAVDLWKHELPDLLKFNNGRQLAISLLRTLNSATGCDVDDPLGFFFTEAYDKRMEEREKVKRISTSDVGECGGNRSSLGASDKLDGPLTIDAVLRLVENLIRERGIKSFGERKNDCAGLQTGDDDLNGLITFKSPSVFIGSVRSIGSIGSNGGSSCSASSDGSSLTARCD